MTLNTDTACFSRTILQSSSTSSFGYVSIALESFIVFHRHHLWILLDIFHTMSGTVSRLGQDKRHRLLR